MEEKIEIKRPIDQLVIGHIPNWILFAGNVVVLFVLAALFVISSKMTFPVVLQGSVTITEKQIYVTIPFSRSNVIKEGQEVVLRINEYPYADYGIVQGKVGRLSQADRRQNIFLVPVELWEQKNKLQRADLIEGMGGSGEIVIDRISILKKILYSRINRKEH